MIGNESCQVSSESKISSSVTVLERNIKQVEEGLAALFKRLTPIRNERSLPESCSKDVPAPIKSHMVNTLDGFSARLNAIRQAIEIVLSDIEI
jgi:hypothetical protein